MKRSMLLSAAAISFAMVAGVAFAQQPQASPKSDCKNAPQKVHGQITSVDPNSGKVVVKNEDGTSHEFKASKETAQTMKAGDKIEATLREAPKC
jgi:Cu/Ag efflux protein CusF